MALVQRLQRVHDRMQTLASDFGIPQYGNVVIQQGTTQTLLDPRPRIMSMTSYDVVKFLSNNVEINADDRWLEGVSRVYTDTQLSQSKFILNAVRVNDSSPWTGLNAEVLFMDKNRLMDWKILVRPLRRR